MEEEPDDHDNLQIYKTKYHNIYCPEIVKIKVKN